MSRKMSKRRQTELIGRDYEKAFNELGEEKLTIHALGTTLAGQLIDGIAEHIEWTQKENERRHKEAVARGELPPQPLLAMAEVNAACRVVAAMNQLIKDVAEEGNAMEGVKEIVRVLEEARKEDGKANRENLHGTD